MKSAFYVILLSLFTLLNSANAGVIWNEFSDGDLGQNLSTSTDFGLLTNPTSSIIGSLDGGPGTFPSGRTNNGPDEYDLFRFTSDVDWSISVPSLTTYEVTGTSTSFREGLLIAVFDSSFNQLGTTTYYSPTDFTRTWVGNAGTYLINLLPNGNQGALDYTVNINRLGTSSVPEPTSLVIFGLGACIAGVTRRRRS